MPHTNSARTESLGTRFKGQGTKERDWNKRCFQGDCRLATLDDRRTACTEQKRIFIADQIFFVKKDIKTAAQSQVNLANDQKIGLIRG